MRALILLACLLSACAAPTPCTRVVHATPSGNCYRFVKAVTPKLEAKGATKITWAIVFVYPTVGQGASLHALLTYLDPATGHRMVADNETGAQWEPNGWTTEQQVMRFIQGYGRGADFVLSIPAPANGEFDRDSLRAFLPPRLTPWQMDHIRADCTHLDLSKF